MKKNLKQGKDLYTLSRNNLEIQMFSQKKQKNKLCCEYIKCFARQRRCNDRWCDVKRNCASYFNNCRYTIKKL